MELLDAEDVADRVTNLVHFDTQEAETGIDLTVGAVCRVGGPGHLDFGGGEFEPAPREQLEPSRKDPDDDYGWWSLDPGRYIFEYNEGFDPESGEFGVVRPLPRLHQAGASHGSFTAESGSSLLEVFVEVGESGIELKENFRASRLQVFARE